MGEATKPIREHNAPEAGDPSFRDSRFPVSDVERTIKDHEKPSRKLAGRDLEFVDESELIDPRELEEFALTPDRIYENYPFYGILLKEKGDHYRRLSEISRGNPLTIEQVEKKHGAGNYQLRLVTRDQKEITLCFSIDAPEQPSKTLNTETEVRNPDHAYDKILKLLEQRCELLTTQLDEKSERVRELNEELSRKDMEFRRQLNDEKDRLQNKLDDLKEELVQKKQRIFELDMDLKKAGYDGEFSFPQLIKEVLSDEKWLGLIQSGIQTAQEKMRPANIHYLNGARDPDHPPYHEPGENIPEFEERPTHHEPEQKQHMQQVDTQALVNDFIQVVSDRGIRALAAEEPDQGLIQETVNGALEQMRSHGFKPNAGVWIEVAKKVITHAVNQNIGAERVAAVVEPVISNIDTAKSILKTTPADVAANLLESTFGFECTAEEKKLLQQVLSVFKQTLE